MPARMDAAVRVDAQNAPTETWKTAQNAVSHSDHTHHHFEEERNQERNYNINSASHTKFLTLPRGPIAPIHVSGIARTKIDDRTDKRR